MYGLSGYDYRVATLFILYLTVIGIIMLRLKMIGLFQHDYINVNSYLLRYGRTDGHTDPNYK